MLRFHHGLGSANKAKQSEELSFSNFAGLSAHDMGFALPERGAQSSPRVLSTTRDAATAQSKLTQSRRAV